MSQEACHFFLGQSTGMTSSASFGATITLIMITYLFAKPTIVHFGERFRDKIFKK